MVPEKFMRPFILTILTLVSFATLVGCGGSDEAGLPTVALTYSPAFDTVCSFFIGGAIKTEWKEELASRQGDFQKLWNTLGPELMQTAETITGKSFPSANFTARLTLCDLPSQSLLGISVNMRFALAGFTETPVPMRYKADTLFHELLHEFLAANPLKDSSLLQQHATEHRRTRDHLHLLALQKAILLSLNETDALQDVIATDSQLPGGYYKRAWEIVNASDAEYLQYIAEISR